MEMEEGDRCDWSLCNLHHRQCLLFQTRACHPGVHAHQDDRLCGWAASQVCAYMSTAYIAGICVAFSLSPSAVWVTVYGCQGIRRTERKLCVTDLTGLWLLGFLSVELLVLCVILELSNNRCK